MKFFLILILYINAAFVYGQGYVDQIANVVNEIASSANISMQIYNPITRAVVYQYNQTTPLIPASNTKLYTTAAALFYAGSDYKLKTALLTSDKNLTDGVINGNLYIKGYGNSLFTIEDMQNFVRDLQSRGIKKIDGNIVGDDTFFDDVYSRADWIDEETKNNPLPPVSSLIINKNTRVQSYNGKRYSNEFNISDPPLYSAMLLRDELLFAGIEVTGNLYKLPVPNEAAIITESAVELRELIKLINKPSDNFLAECLFKTVGAVYSNQQGNAFHAAQAIKTFLQDDNIYSNGTYIVDGSGLSKNNLTSAASLVGLLERMYFDLVHFDDFYNSLSISGHDGTLRRRINDTGQLSFRGKTGTLNGVTSLTGYLTTDSGEDLIIAIIINFKSGSRSNYKDLENKIIQLAARL